MDEAESDLAELYEYIANKAGSRAVAREYVTRILDFIGKLAAYPERGTVRSEIRQGLRIIGFERAAAIAFVIEGNEVVILRISYRGREIFPNVD